MHHLKKPGVSTTSRPKTRNQQQPSHLPSEHEICEEIIAYCEKRHIPWFRNNVGVARYGKRRVRFGTPGMADYTIILRWKTLPLMVFVEVKDDEGEQRIDQVAFQQWCNTQHICYLLVRSVEELDAGIASYLQSIAKL